ncbi:MAG TPA: MFS transporter [Lactobacillaceae bacterium]|jgi:EmrB/QacA subfamily drug resistance transporter
MTNTKRWFILLSVALFTFMSTLDTSIVNIALPVLAKNLGIMTSQSTYAVVVYLVVIAGLLVTMGRLGDLFGKVRLFKYGTHIFTIGSLLAGISPTLNWLLVARAVQAVGAAATMANGFGIIADTFPPEMRGRAMGFVTVANPLGFIAGPALGSLLLSSFQWQAIFLVNVPVGLIAIGLGALFLPKNVQSNAGRFDFVGAVLLFGALTSLFGTLEVSQNIGFSQIWWLLVVAILLIVGFVLYERRLEQPLLDLRVFLNHGFSLSVGAGLMMVMTNSFWNLLLPFYLESYRGWSLSMASALMIIFPVGMIVSAPLGGFLGDKLGKYPLMVTGLVLALIAQIGYVYVDHASFTILAIFTVLTGIGNGLFLGLNAATTMSFVQREKMGVAGAINSLSISVGQLIGVVVPSLILYGVMSHLAGHTITTVSSASARWFLPGMHAVFAVAFGFVLVSLILVVLRQRKVK